MSSFLFLQYYKLPFVGNNSHEYIVLIFFLGLPFYLLNLLFNIYKLFINFIKVE